MSDSLPWPVQEVSAWPEWWQGVAVFLSTFILEDAAVVAAGLLLAAKAIGWPVAFGASFTGIWMGDIGLYAVARLGGRPWVERSPLKRFGQRVATPARLS